MIKVADPLVKLLLELLTTMKLTSIDDAIQRKMHGRGVARAGKGITSVISFENFYDVIRIIKSPENSGALIDGVSETIKYDIK